MIRMSSIWTGTAEYLFPLAPDDSSSDDRKPSFLHLIYVDHKGLASRRQRAAEYGARPSFVDQGGDSGPLILQLGQPGSLRFDHFGRRPRDKRLVAELGAKRAELAI